MTIPKLDISLIPVGSHGFPHSLGVLLYVGGAAAGRKCAQKKFKAASWERLD